jgi:hypothetical protein
MAKSIKRDVENARSSLQQKEGAITPELRSAKVQVDRTKMQFEGIRKQIYKEPGRPTEEKREMLIARGEAYKKALKDEENTKAKKEALLEDVRKAKRRGFELLDEILKESALPATPPTTKIGAKTIKKAPSRDPIIDQPKFQPTVEDVTEDESPDRVDTFLRAAEQLKQSRKHATATR